MKEATIAWFTAAERDHQPQNAADRCARCGADRDTIARDGHRWLDRRGRVVGIETPDARPCPEACSCAGEHFSMAEHHAAHGSGS